MEPGPAAKSYIPPAVVRLRRFLACLLALLSISCAARNPAWLRVTADPEELEEKAERAGLDITERFVSPEGILVYRRFLDSPPDLLNGPLGDLADAACWGGYWLAAEALRHRVLGTAESRLRVGRALAGIEFLERVTGVPGLVARTADHNVPPRELAMRGGEWNESAISGWFWRGDVSKDQIAGVLFGLGCVLRHVPDPDLTGRAGALVVRIASHIEQGGLTLTDADGEPTRHGDLSPSWVGIPLAVNASLVLAAFRLSALAGGPPSHARRYRELVDQGYAWCASFAKVAVFGKTNRNNDHMATASLYHLVFLEEDPEVREHYRRGLARVARGVRGEGNALFLGLHLAASGPREDLLTEALAALALFPVDRRSAPMDLRGRRRGVVPIGERAPSSFLWRSDPTKKKWGPRGRRDPVEYAAVDLAVAWWLLRAEGLVPWNE